MKGNHFKKIKIMLIAMLFIIISGYMLISTAIAALAQDVDVSKVKNVVDVNLEKYVNYNLDEKKGTLLQLNVKTGIEYEEGTEYVPLSSTGILLNVPKINNKFPQSVEVFEKSTKATNGDEQGKDVRYKYVSETGQIIILTANEEQNGEIYKEYVKDAKDDISIVLDYDESCRLEENTKNQLDITGFVQTKLATQNETKVQGEIKAQIEIEKQVSNVVSSDVKTSDIYNGFIKMNVKNNSNYKTTYNESFGINISKKDLADETKIEIENSFIKNEEKTAIKDISYVSSKINKNRVLDIFGQDGYFKVLDETGKVLAEINKDTQVDKDGNYEIKYADGVSKLFAVFSKPNKVGYININSTKEIEPSFKELDVNKLQVISKIKSVNKIKDVQNNEIEKEVYNFEDTKEIEIKNTQSVVKLSVNNAKWTNQKQNDVELNVKLLASESSHSLFKNPIIKILLPEEVEKVVLGNVKVTNGNGLNFKNAEYNNENRILTVTLEGEQAEYLSKNLAEGTNVIIPANIILGQEIESKNTKLGVAYVNEATSEKGMFKVDVEVENFRQVQNTETEINTSVPTVVRQVQRAALKSETPNVETAEGVEIEVVPTRCTDILNNGDTVYEGEFIKYNIKVKNTSNDTLENVKLIADLPEGVKYVKEIGNYNETNNNIFLENTFEYDEEIRQLPIEIGALEKGQIINKEFQIRVKDLENSEIGKQLETSIRVYIGNGLSDAYRIMNEVQKAEYKVTLFGSTDSNGSFRYELNVEGDTSKKVGIKLNLPDNSSIASIYADNDENEFNGEISKDNSFEIIPGKYIIAVTMEEKFLKQENCNQTILKASAIVDNKYKSNETIIIYKYENVTIEMSSPTSGEDLNGGQEIVYNIKIKNITDDSNNVFQNNMLELVLKDKLPKELTPISIKYENYNLNSETYEFEKQEIEKNLFNIEEESFDIDEFLRIPHGKEVNIIVKAEVAKIYDDVEITNFAIVEDAIDYDETNDINEEILKIGKISSNVITNNILEFTEADAGEEPTEPGTPLEPIILEGGTEEELPDDYSGNISGEEDNQNDQENTENGENQGQTDSEDTADKKYSITGIAWKDENEDGQKQDNEENLSGIEVLLVDSNGKDISRTTTDNDGQYAFNNLNNGNYIVVFKYDVSKYRLTEYQKQGVENKYNSDAIKTEREIDGKSVICGVTNLIKLNSNLENIDIGLIENKKFNFKIDKYISKVVTTTSQGTDSKDYNNAKLAKTEIKSKEIENASVKVEYKIIITNDGEVPGTVGKVVEKLSSGLKLSSDVNNKTWYKNQDGSLVNTSMSGQIIEPGKRLELELIADVSNNSGVIGNYKNTVILEEISNNLGIVDNNIEDNFSNAELIVSVSTGGIIYISIIISIMVIIGLLIFLNKKYGIFKHMKVLRLFVGIVLFSSIIAGYIEYTNAFDIHTFDQEVKPPYVPPKGWIHVSNSSNDGLYHTRFIWAGDCKEEKVISSDRCFMKIPKIYGNGSDWKIDISSIQEHQGACIDAGFFAQGTWGREEYYKYSRDFKILLKNARDAANDYDSKMATYKTILRYDSSNAEKYKNTELKDAEDTYNDALDEFNNYARRIPILEYYSEGKSDVKKLSTQYSYRIHYTTDRTTTKPKISLSNLNKNGKTELKDLNDGYYLVGPLKMKDESDESCKSYKNSSNYVFNVKFNNKVDPMPIYDTYNANGVKISNTVKPGTYSFYIKVKKSDIEAYNGIENISTCVQGKQKVTYNDVTEYYRIWWPADLSTYNKAYQRVIEKPDGSDNKKKVPHSTETDIGTTISWTVDSEIAQFQKVAYLNDKKDKDTVAPISGIQFVLRRKSDSTWVKKVNGVITYGGWDNNVVKLTTDANGNTPKLIGLSVNQEYEVFEILTNELKKYYKEESRIANTNIDVIKLVSFKAKKGLNTISAPNYRKKAEVILEKRDEFDNERTAAEKINFENVKFVLCRQYYEDLKTVSLEWVAQNKDQNVLYDKNKPIEYVKWDNNNKQNSKKLVVLTATKQKDGTYKTEKITGLEPGYYVAYEFIEGCDSYTNKFNLPDHLKELYKPADTLFAGCKLKNVGYINITNTERNGYKPLLPYNKTNKAQFNILLTNVVDYSKVQIFKTNDEKVPLKGVQFKIYKHEAKPKIDPNSRSTEQPGWLVFNSKGEVIGRTQQNGNDPNTILTTDEKGYTQMLSKLRVSDKVYDRYYSVYEIYIPDKFRKIYEIDKSPDAVNLNELDGLKEKNKGLPAQYGLLKKKFKAVANKDKLISITADNPQYYVSLKGNVWEDHKDGKNIKTINNLYGNEDNNISGIIVKLMDKTGNQIKQTITNSDGRYTFDKVLVSEIKAGNYYIEFEYDGLTYQTVNQDKGLNNSLKVGAKTVSIPAANTSKAGETSSRTDLNNSFTALTGDGQKINNNTLNYEKRNDDVYLQNTCEWDWIRTEATNNKKGTVKINTQGAFQVKAIIDADYLKNAYTKMKEGYKDNKQELLFTIPNLNLGLYQREQVDLALSKDTYSAQIDINGKKYTYLYGQKLDESVQNLIEKDIPTAQVETSLGVGFERKNPLSDDLKYKAPIHKADAEYELNNNVNANSDGELKVTITYAIGLVNNSPTLYGKVNKIKEYYSSDCTFVDKKVYLDKECTTPLSGVTIENESTLNNAQLDKDTVSRNYKTFDINFGNSGIVLTPKTNKDCVKYIYVKMELPKTSFYDFVNHRVYEDKEFRNFAEISSYTTYSAYNANNKTGTLYATFDYNSVPNTINTNNSKLRKHENDSNFAPGLQLVLAEERTLSGVVFEDKPIETLLNFQRRQGDGFRGYFDKGIKGVTVQLVPTSLININTDKFAQEYEFANVTAPNVDTVNNYYVSKGLTGSILTTTTDENGKFELKGIVPGNYQIRYIWGLNNGTTLSDGTKVSVGEYKSTMYYEHSSYNPKEWYLTSLLDGRKPQVNNHSEAIDSWKERLDFDHELPASYNDYNINTPKLNQSMNSWTDVLDMSVEVVGDVNNGYKIVEENEDVKYKYDIKSIDFGLIERPHQQLVISKELKKIKIKDSQDRVIVDAEVIEENGKKTFKNIKDVLYTVFLPESSTNPSGTVKSEIDKDYMPVKIEATYNVSVINAGEYDFKTQKWYYSNSADFRNDEKVTLRATDVYDYLVNNFDIEASDSNYEVITKEDYNNKISESRIEAGYSNQFKDWRKSENKIVTAADGTVITSNSWKYGNAILSTLYERWFTETTASKTIRDVKVDGTKIINLTDLSKPLAAGESSTASYTVTSLVQNKDDEIRLDNEAEIIEIERSSDFGKSRIETYKTLYDGGESVIITPPTGENRSKEEVNILAISLASGLGVLAIGLIFIKRRISKHNKNV